MLYRVVCSNPRSTKSGKREQRRGDNWRGVRRERAARRAQRVDEINELFPHWILSSSTPAAAGGDRWWSTLRNKVDLASGPPFFRGLFLFAGSHTLVNMLCNSIRCIARPQRLIQHTRQYANGRGNLIDLAARIQATPSIKKAPPPSNRVIASPQPEGLQRFTPNKPYNPYDFEPVNRLPPTHRRMIEPSGPPRALAVRQDVFYQLGINPLDEVLNCSLISSFTTDMGRIQKRNETKLTWRSQRKIGKAIRRARAMGLVPSFSRWEDSMIKSR